MESHPLAKLVVGILGIAIVGTAFFWIGRSGGSTTADESGGTEQTQGADDSKPVDGRSQRPVISKEGPHPQVKLAEEMFNFGTIAAGSGGSHAFKVQNTGKAPLVLVKGPTSCKCTISELSEGAIPPGGSAVIDLAWKTQSSNPEFQQRATIWTNDPKMEEFDLSIMGQILEEIEVVPSGIWFVGEASLGEETSVTGHVFSRILESFEIDASMNDSDRLNVELEPMNAEQLKVMDAKSGYLVKVSVSTDVPVGSFREKLVLKVKDHDLKPLEVYIGGNRKGPISFLSARRTRWNPTSMSVDLGEFDAKAGAEGALFLFVRGLEDREFEFQSIKSDPEDLEVKLIPDAKFEGTDRKKYELEFKLPGGRLPMTRSTDHPAKVTIKTNHPEAGTLEFRLKYIAR